MRVRLVQWASGLDPAANRRRLEELGPGGDLIVLPEAFARDFGEPGSDLSAYAEPMDGLFVQALRANAERTGAAMLAGMFEVSSDPARPLNTLAFVTAGAEGAVTAYRKMHLYDSFGYRESDTISSGSPKPTLVDLAGLRIGLLTCYDLRFPELARALVEDGAQVLVVPSAWASGERKVDHWRTLVRARAIENVAYVVAVGQPGPRYTGHSMVVSPLGEILAEADDGPDVLDAVLDPEVVALARRVNPSLDNRRLGGRRRD